MTSEVKPLRMNTRRELSLLDRALGTSRDWLRRGRGSILRWLAILASVPLLTSCFSLTVQPRALVVQPDGTARAMLLACPPASEPRRAASAGATLNSSAIRMVTWNIHKEADAGWQKDLNLLAQAGDIVLLQEVTLGSEVRAILRDVDLDWVMASSFTFGDDDIGVLTASRVAPSVSCTQRVVEPILRLPKSAVISWFALSGTTRTLAVVNVHAINFSLSVVSYREQMNALTDALNRHDGPIIFAGDLNTWSAARLDVIADVVRRLGLEEITFAEDKRTLFFGKQLDHILVRGLRVLNASAIAVKSSDHNPVTATLEVVQP